MRNLKLLVFLTLLCTTITCFAQTENSVTAIETAHKKEAFLSQKAIQFDAEITFGGKEHLKGNFVLATDSSKGVITLNDGGKIYIDANKVYHTPHIKNEAMVRFDAYTWSYFMLLPYKLADKGTIWSEFETATLNNTELYRKRLSFETGTGDAPDDWYYIYSDTKTNLLSYAAYIVTFGSSKEKAEKDPHAIKYNKYTTIQGIPLATDWSFWEWNKTTGLGKQLGAASITNIKFVTPKASVFKAPENAISK